MKSDKLISNEVSGVNQILPHTNKWAWDLMLKGAANNWMPMDVTMQKDIEQWKSKDTFSADERLVVKRCLGFFAGSESLVANNLLLTIFKYITDPECRQYLSRQNWEESLHNLTVVYICDSLGLDVKEVYEAYNSVPAIKAKDDFLMDITSNINRPDFDINTVEGKQELLRNIFTYYIVCEGTFFFSGFAMLLSFGRQNKLPGIAEQIQYTLRDECVSDDTELLTPKGWKKVSNILDTDLIAQYNANETINFTKPIKISKTNMEKCFLYTNQEHSVDLMVSKNHRIIFKNRNKKSENYNCLCESFAEDFNHHGYTQHIMAGKKSNGDKKLTNMERLLIAMQADSHICNNGYHNGNLCGELRIIFSLTKDRKKIRLRNLLNDCSIKYIEKVDGDNSSFSFNLDKEYCTKEFSDWVNLENVSYEWCVDFIEELSHWDSHIYSKDRIIYCSTNKNNIDIAQAISCLANYKTNITLSIDDRKESYKDYYRMSIFLNKNYINGQSICKKEVEYNKDVYGVEVESGMIIVRRNDCVSVTGNSIHIQFGTTLINKLRQQYPEVWTKQFEIDSINHLKKALELEVQYANDVLPRGILGLNASMFTDYMKYIVNRRLTDLGLEPVYNNVHNPFSWMSEVIDLTKMKNFFETRVTDYQSSTIVDDF